MTQILFNNVGAKIVEPLPRDILMRLSGACSFPMAGHEYSPKFKAGHWDGRVQLFQNRSQEFPTGLIHRVVQTLELYGTKVQLVDQRPPASGEVRRFDWNQDYEVRPYQMELADALSQNYRGIVKAATGAGKTLMMAKVIRDNGRRTLVLVDGIDLAHQTVKALRKYLPGAPVGLIGDGCRKPEFITVAVIQAVAHHVGLVNEKVGDGEEAIMRPKDCDPWYLNFLGQQEVVEYDECHGLAAKHGIGTMRLCLRAFIRGGFSATPLERGDGANLLNISQTGEILGSITSSELIVQGYLSRPNIHCIEIHEPRLRKKLPYDEIYTRGITENNARNSLIVKLTRWRVGITDVPAVLILVVHINHGAVLSNMLTDMHVPNVFIHGSLDTGYRQKALDDFRAGKLPVLIGTTILNKGIDLPNITDFINAGGLKDRIQTQQKLGRALHVVAPTVEVWDIMDFTHEKLSQHSLERLEIYRAEPEYRVFNFDPALIPS